MCLWARCLLIFPVCGQAQVMTSSQTPLCRLEWTWTTVDSTLREGASVVDGLLHSTYIQAFLLSSGVLASPTHAVGSVLATALLWAHFTREAAELTLSLRSSVHFVNSLVGRVIG